MSARLYDIEKRLRRFGDGAKGFVFSLIETAIEVSGGAITAREIESILGFLRELLEVPVRLLDGAREILAHLSLDYKLVLLSKGELSTKKPGLHAPASQTASPTSASCPRRTIARTRASLSCAERRRAGW